MSYFEEMPTVHQTFYMGTFHLNLKSDLVGKEKMDTQVSVGDTTLCWIAGQDIQGFVKELKDLIDKYKI